MLESPVSRVALEPGQVALFASDMHLCDEEPAIAAYFFAQLKKQLPEVTHLFLLGDIFESWFGDDGADSIAGELIELLKQLNAQGLTIYVMRGNRDFLLNAKVSQETSTRQDFSQRSHSILLADETVLTAFGTDYLLCHADQLCTLDSDYQAFRQQTRSGHWQNDFLSRSFEERKAIAKRLRDVSKASREAPEQSDSAMMDSSDVTQEAVESLMQRYEVWHLIHGHTHRPADHEFIMKSHAAKRHVLADWSDHSGGFLKLSASGLERITLPA